MLRAQSPGRGSKYPPQTAAQLSAGRVGISLPRELGAGEAQEWLRRLSGEIVLVLLGLIGRYMLYCLPVGNEQTYHRR